MNSKLKTSIIIGIIVSVIASTLFFIGFLSNINQRLTDNLYGGHPSFDSIVIISIDDKSLQEIGRWPWNRDVFAEVIKELDEAAVVGVDIAFLEYSNNDQKLKEISNQKNLVLTAEYTNFDVIEDKVIGKGLMKPVVKSSIGYVNIITDNDGIARATNLNVQGNIPSFTEAVYKKFLGKNFSHKKSRFLINFAGPPETYKRFSFADVYTGRTNKTEFKDKIVFIGATAPDFHDEQFVPTSKGKAMPGVEIHANTLQTMLQKNFLENESKFLVILTIIITALLTSIIMNRLKIWPAITIVVISNIVYTFFAIYLFDYGIIIELVYVPITTITACLSVIGYFYIFEEKQKKQVQTAFGKYVSPIIVDELMKNPEKLKLGGQKKEITLLFSDIRNFTSISEKLTAEELVSLLNEYLNEMTGIIMENKGIVDKYIGDAIMAFWGAPLDDKNHAVLGCKAAIEMQKKLPSLQEKWKKEGKPKLTFGVGLNTGEVVVGNMGSEKRFDYTIIGDSVNLGSRLESLTKQYGIKILASENTYNATKEKFDFREVDLVKVKGKSKPVHIYELMLEKNDEFVKKFEEALKIYRLQKWDKAKKLFNEAKKIKKDKTSELYLERIEYYKKHKVPKNWDGSFTHLTK